MKFLAVLLLGVLSCQAEEAKVKGSEVLEDFSVGYNTFTANIYKELTKNETGSFLTCPLSVNIILALIHDGAKGETAEQLSKGCNLPDDKLKVRQIFQELIPRLQHSSSNTMYSANKMYVKQGYGISQEFKNAAIGSFYADIEAIDFEKGKKAAATMNKWVEEKTDSKIKDIIRGDDLDEDTFAVLINAMYFHGKWMIQFRENETKIQHFHMDSKNYVKIDMMETTSGYNYYESVELNAKFLEMPYEEEELSMTFILPNDVGGLSRLEENIEKLLVAPNYSLENVHVTIPKFKVQTTIEFKPILEALGVVEAFQDTADFTDIGSEHEPLKINKIVQKTFIDVQEKGTTAAAAASVMVLFSRSGGGDYAPKEFKANRPFIYYIKSSQAGVLFIGRYVNVQL